jgi:hypothetical protein
MKNLMLHPTKAGLIVILTVLFLLSLIAPSYACDAVCGVEKAILYLMKTAPAAKLVKNSSERQKLAGEITEASHKYEIDAYLLTAIFYSESSFNINARGSAGETGMGQIGNTSRAQCKAAGLKIATRTGQVACTAWLLKGYEHKCGTIKGAVTAYAGWGRCKTSNQKKQRQVRYKLNLAKKLQRIGTE